MTTEAIPTLDFVHRFEPGADPAARPLLLLHGTGGDENDLIEVGRMVSPGSVLLSPRGKVLEHGAPRFFRRLAEGVFDQQDLEFRTAELARFLTQAAAAYGFDQSRLIALGFSNGANIASSLLLRFPESLAGAILLRGMVPFVPSESPDLRSKHILLSNGVHDPIVPRQQPEQLAADLRRHGASVELQWQPAGHALIPGDIAVASTWLRKLA
jgi:phospholipase/carboxylesterase